MHAGQELHAKRRLEALDQLGHALEARNRLRMLCQERPRCVHRSRDKLQRLVGLISTVTVAGEQMAFNIRHHVAKVLGIGAVWRFLVS